MTALSVGSRMRGNPGGKSIPTSPREPGFRPVQVITCSCNLSSLDCSGQLALTKDCTLAPNVSQATI